MDGRPTWTDCDEAGDYYVVPNVLSPRDLVSRPDNMDETVPHTDMPSNSYMSPCFWVSGQEIVKLTSSLTVRKGRVLDFWKQKQDISLVV